MRAVVVERPSGLRAAVFFGTTYRGRELGLVFRANSGTWTNYVELGGAIVLSSTRKMKTAAEACEDALELLEIYRKELRRRARVPRVLRRRAI